MTSRRISTLTGATLALLAAGASLPVQARLAQQQIQVPVEVRDAAGKPVSQAITVQVSYDDASRQPRPIAIINHGRPADGRAKADMGRATFSAATDFFVKRGYLVAVPTRVGYGVSAGPDVEASGNCSNRNFGPGFAAAASQIVTVLDAVRRRPDVAQTGAVLVGHSYGGVASLAAAAQRPQNVRVVFNMSGGAGGDPVSRPGEPCSTFQLAQQLRQIGASSRVPTLWVYAANDRYFGSSVPRQWFDAYQRIGGVAEWVMLPAVGKDGHALFTHFPAVWQPLVANYLQRLNATTPLQLRTGARP